MAELQGWPARWGCAFSLVVLHSVQVTLPWRTHSEACDCLLSMLQVDEVQIIELMEKITTGVWKSVELATWHLWSSWCVCYAGLPPVMACMAARTQSLALCMSCPDCCLCKHTLLTAWRPEGEWIARLDLVEQGDRLVVQEMEQVGEGICRV